MVANSMLLLAKDRVECTPREGFHGSQNQNNPIRKLAIDKSLSITNTRIDNGFVTQGTARARPAPSACVLLLQEIVSQLLIGNDYANSSITKTHFLIVFRSLSPPCTAD